MRLKFNLLIALVFVALISYGQDQKIKKITIERSNNPILNYNIKKLRLPDSINTPELVKLRDYVLAQSAIKSKQEPELFFELMEWVSKQWNHNGWHAAPDSLNSLGILKSARNEGQEYRCVEYGIVLNDILKSFGYPSRTVGLKHIDVDYGGAGMAHVATEVWSNNLEKWIFLDPQFGIYAQKDNKPLNIYEIYQIKASGNFNDIQFTEVATNETSAQYGNDFLANYLGYVDIHQKTSDQNYSLALKMEGKRDYLTFQAFPGQRTVFTTNTQDLYYKLNQSMVFIDFADEEVQRSNNEFSKLKIESIEDFNNNMPLFAAQPNLSLSLANNMPWFKTYSVKLNNIPVKEQAGKYPINLKTGDNIIQVVAINQNNIEGVPTVVNIKYQ